MTWSEVEAYVEKGNANSKKIYNSKQILSHIVKITFQSTIVEYDVFLEKKTSNNKIEHTTYYIYLSSFLA